MMHPPPSPPCDPLLYPVSETVDLYKIFIIDLPETTELADFCALKSESAGSESRKSESSVLSKLVDVTLCTPSVSAEIPLQLGRAKLVVSWRADLLLANC